MPFSYHYLQNEKNYAVINPIRVSKSGLAFSKDVQLGKRFIMNIIEIKKLGKTCGKSRGIIDVDLTVQEDEIFGL